MVWNLLLVSTPVGALGSGLGGGVELTLQNIAQELRRRGHLLTILAPDGSALPGLAIASVPGKLQITAQSQGRETGVTMPDDSVLANLWEQTYQRQRDYDVIINFAYDWLPFYLTPFFHRPIAHLVSMGSLTLAMDQVIERTLNKFPGTIGVHSRAQADTFDFGDRCRCLGNGLELAQYQFWAEPESVLGWVGRIAPEKGLEDAIAAAQTAGMPLKIWGAMAEPDYWQRMLDSYPKATFCYEGFLPTAELQQGLGRCQGLLMTPKWVEAFGNVAIEALACGVPVIAYRRGGPMEIVTDGQTGWLVEPDDVEGLVRAIAQLQQIDRRACRQRAEAEYSMQAMGDRIEAWLRDILAQVGDRASAI
ncbi:MAG: glycosyltransferase family 4 protein [Oculatellaceae cyanobacterium Prado106]|jgi:UDP-glucose:tetrahydrobiopterin glucosyltransferase|nr:glycosyltransferase family 4 protein [Oculatellaceae cyanobacterium Prado106]